MTTGRQMQLVKGADRPEETAFPGEVVRAYQSDELVPGTMVAISSDAQPWQLYVRVTSVAKPAASRTEAQAALQAQRAWTGVDSPSLALYLSWLGNALNEQDTSLHVDWASLEGIGINRTLTIRLPAATVSGDARLKQVLAEASRPLDRGDPAEYFVDAGGTVIVSTRSALDQKYPERITARQR